MKLCSINVFLSRGFKFARENKEELAQIFIIFLILIGGSLRLKHFLENPSLWLDEAALAINIAQRTLDQILSSTYRESVLLPTAPIGFLAIEKVMIQLFGLSESAWRFFPFLVSIFSIIRFSALLKENFSKLITVLALSFLLFSPTLIYYSAELKHYAFDVAFAIFLIWSAFRILNSSKELNTLFLGVLGFFSIIFSYSALFILPGVWMVLVAASLFKKQYTRLKFLLIIVAVWLYLFGVVYIFELSQISGSKVLSGMWNNSFLPADGTVMKKIEWSINAFLDFFKYMFGAGINYPAIILFFVGCFKMFKESKDKFFILIIPLILCFIATVLRKYPFYERFLLFLFPCIYIFMAKGIEFIFVETRNRVVLIVLCSFLLIRPIAASLEAFVKGYFREEMRPVMTHLKENLKPTDVFYINDAATFAFYYYTGALSFPGMDYYIGKIADTVTQENACIPMAYEIPIFNKDGWVYKYAREQRDDYRLICRNAWLEGSGNPRTWIIFSHDKKNLKELVLESLNQKGRMLDHFEATGASIYLYDLSKNKME